jgi:ribosomal protein L11 methyltransferase
MDNFWVVTLFHLELSQEGLDKLQASALNDYDAAGIEEYSLSEAEVDEILGMRSYSGGDLPQEVLDEVDEVVLGRAHHYRFYFESQENAEKFKAHATGSLLCEAQVELAKNEDWNAEWRKHYSPIKVSDELEIIPSWLEDYQSKAHHKLFIYPGQGFGTGSHETTFLCLKLFSQYCSQTSIDTVLDFGSGSGILGLAALKFYPEAKVDFYDIDAEANKNCFQNAEINQLADKKFRLLLPEYRNYLQEKYDVVFANILENILLLEGAALAQYTRKEGYLIVSGLLNHQAAGIIEKYSNLSLELVESVSQGDWSAIIFKKV